MNLSERLADDMKKAMKDKDKMRLSVIRMVRSAMKYHEIESGATLSDEEVIVVIQKELKQRRDSLQAFESAGRTDLIDDISTEISILIAYLPEQLTEVQLRQIVEQTIIEVGASKSTDIGRVMGKLMPQIRGKADGFLAQRIVHALLS